MVRLSLLETCRSQGKHQHVASLGMAELPLAIAGRLRFWTQPHPRLDRLANPLSKEDRGNVLAAVHAGVPMVTADERRALQRQVATDEIKFWERMQGVNEELSNGNRELAVRAEAHQRKLRPRKSLANMSLRRATASPDLIAAKTRPARDRDRSAAARPRSRSKRC